MEKMKYQAIITLFLVLHLSFVAFAQQNKQVLLISSYNSRFPTFFQQIDGIKSVLDTANVNIDVEFLDSKRFTYSGVRDLFYETLKNKLAHNSARYDAILAADDDAFNFALQYEDELFKNIPIIFFGVNNIENGLKQNSNPNVTGVIEAVSMKETINLMIDLFPETKTIYCITDSTSTGLSDLKLYRQIATQTTGTEFKEINLSQLTFPEYKVKINEVPTKAPVMLLSAYLDKTHQTVDFGETLKILKQNCKAPIFHLYEHGMNEGILGGKLISHYEQGKTAARMVLNILAGESVASIEVVDKSPNVFKFDFNQLSKYKIALSQLPQGSIIINQPFTFWQKYKRFIVLSSTIIGVLVIFILGLSANILKRKKVEKQLKDQNSDISKLNSELFAAKVKAEEGELKFKQLFYDHSAVKLLIDVETGQIFDANPAASKFYGWSLEKLRQMNISDINTLPFSAIRKEMDIAKIDRKVHFEFKHRKADESSAEVEIFSSSVTISGKEYLYSIVHDVTDKKKHEHNIRLLSRSVEQSPVAIIITDKDGVIEYVNPAFTEISGYSYDKAIGQNTRILSSGETTNDVYNTLWETINAGKTWIGEIQNKKASGEFYWINIAISPIYNNNELTNFVAVSEDITEKKRIIEDLIVAKNKAEESNNLKTEFLNNMSHEIRTPMNGIVGFSEMLNDETIDKESRKEFTDIIIKCSHQLLNIIDDILEISRLETHQVTIHQETFCLNTLIKELHLLFYSRAREKGLSFIWESKLDDDKSYITTDKAKFNRILINLIENALKFTNQGAIKIGYYLEQNRLKLFVKDTGVGISEENINRIFDRFVQEEKKLSQKYGGIGLGLAISKENAILINGDITVESVKNSGSTFYLTIPYQASEDSQPDATTEVRKIASEENFTLLVAEDEEINYIYIKTLLKKWFNSKINLLYAENGQEAVDACNENSAIDLVLMDIRMPVLDGYEATEIIKTNFPNLPIIALTAYSTESDKARALKAGCNEFVTKPINRTILFELLERYLMKNS